MESRINIFPKSINSFHYTKIGLLASAFVFLLLAIYLGYKIMIMLNHENSKITEISFYRNIVENNDMMNVSDLGFDFAFAVMDIKGNYYNKPELFEITLT
jgi:TRAP-type C4-dicarboxylate transport system permease small subunit